jgi:hypothetical protein
MKQPLSATLGECAAGTLAEDCGLRYFSIANRKEGFMDHLETETKLREQLKILLYFFAKHSDQPGVELQQMLREVIQDLYEDVAAASAAQKKLKLVVSNQP